MSNKCLHIGITGGIGSGKTLVTQIFSILGVSVYNADERARWISDQHPEVRKEIIAAFGEDAYKDGVFNRRYIAGIVFQDAAKTALLNAIVHPRVGADFESWAHKHADRLYVLKEAALMYESGSYKQLDKVIVVTAPLELRIRRVQLRDPHRTRAEILGIIDKQLPEEERIKRADFLLHNDEQHLLIPAVLAIHEQLSSGKI
jgi:dephospho-CoA kinase